MKNRNRLLGLLMLILGIIFLLENLSVIQLDFIQIWPILIILGGLGFWLGFLLNRKSALLIMPGTILFIYGVVFLYCQLAGWQYMVYLWPVFLIGPGLAFVLLYYFGNREKSFLLPAAILTILGLLFIFRHLPYLKYWPVLLLLGGIYIMFMDDIRRAFRKKQPE